MLHRVGVRGLPFYPLVKIEYPDRFFLLLLLLLIVMFVRILYNVDPSCDLVMFITIGIMFCGYTKCIHTFHLFWVFGFF